LASRLDPPRLRTLFRSLPSSASHSFLPSFPTRRSSDLARLGIRARVSANLAPLHRHGLPHGGARDAGFRAVCLGSRGTQHRERQDRKSTRLNSSHVEISYAVFCLKKKK